MRPALLLLAMSSYLAFLSLLSPVPCRDDLALVAERNFSKTGVAVEVGVFRGGFSKRNLKVWTKKYYQVDAWSFRMGDPEDKNFRHDTINVANQNAAWRAVAPFKGRVTQMKALSRDAAVKFAESSIDWLYIDALHTRDALYGDLVAWWDKVRPGGLISGDDYGDTGNTSLMTSTRWEHAFGAVARSNKWGVISALEQFTAEKQVILHTTWVLDCYKWPAWYFVKPF